MTASTIRRFRPGASWYRALYAGPGGPWLESDSEGLEWPGEHWIAPFESSSSGGWQLGRRMQLPQRVWAVALGDDAAWALRVREEDDRDFDHKNAALRIPFSNGTLVPESQIDLPGMVGPVTAAGGRAWCVSRHRLPLPPAAPEHSLLRLTAGATGGVEVARVDRWPDITSLIPDPAPPIGTDPQAWAEAQRASLEAELAQESVRVFGISQEDRGYIRGVTIESVTLAGSYPATERVIRFRLRKRPGVPFGRRLRCFDDLGAPRRGDYDGLQLWEDIETNDVPPPGRDIPDSDGVVWI